MLIIKTAAAVPESGSKKRKRKKKQPVIINSSTVFINGSPHYVIDVSPELYDSVLFRELLNKYRGKVICEKNLENIPIIKESLADISEFMKCAVFYSFVSFIKSADCIALKLVIIDSEGILAEIMPLIIKSVKELIIVSESSKYGDRFINNCYEEFGAKPKVVSHYKMSNTAASVYADFDSVRSDGVLKFTFKGISKSITPDESVLYCSDEAAKLLDLGIRKEYICAVFGGVKHKTNVKLSRFA